MTEPAPTTKTTHARVRAVDWLRGLVMVLMTIDHVGNAWDKHHLHGDSAFGWTPGSPLPAGEFLTRWITHVCAPAFVLLAGASLALSAEKRKGQPGQTAFIVKRGLFIAALDPTWMSLGFTAWHLVIFQVLFAIGMSLVCMAFLRRLSSAWLLGGAIAIQACGELSTRVDASGALGVAWSFLFTGGPVGYLGERMVIVGYPLLPWLSMMMAGWVLGRWLLATRDRDHASRARTLAMIGCALLVVFAIVRGVDGYGNWGLHRDSLAPLQWLHVAKYPPSLSYTTLELGLAFFLLAGFLAVDDAAPRRWLAPLGTLGATAFFYYLLHAHLAGIAAVLMHPNIDAWGLFNTYFVSAIVILVLYPLCVRYRRYKSAHPDGWTRYI
jgi:uncharacterized membrane protein